MESLPHGLAQRAPSSASPRTGAPGTEGGLYWAAAELLYPDRTPPTQLPPEETDWSPSDTQKRGEELLFTHEPHMLELHMLKANVDLAVPV